MTIDKNKFIFLYADALGPLKQDQREGLAYLLESIERDPHMTDPRHVAYMLATIRHETAGTWRPIHEYGNRAYFIGRYGSQTRVGKELGNKTPEDGALYAGRGFAQVTGKANYQMIEAAIRREYPEVVARFEQKTGRAFDLTVGDQPNDEKDPDNMKDAEIAYCAMSYGMRKGAFTGVGFSRYINDKGCDFFNARKIINRLDCASSIAAAADKILKILTEVTA